MNEEKVEKKQDLGSSLLTGEQLENILEGVWKKNVMDNEAWQKLLMERHQSNIINVDGWVAILDIGLNRITTWDGTNGYYEIVPTFSEESMAEYIKWKVEETGKSNYQPSEDELVTKQGLIKRYRFRVVINDLASPNSCEYNIVKGDKVLDDRTMSTESRVAMMQRRV